MIRTPARILLLLAVCGVVLSPEAGAGPAFSVETAAMPLFLEQVSPAEVVGESLPDIGLLVRVNDAAIQGAAPRLGFFGPDGSSLDAVLTDHEIRGPGDATWLGRLDGSGERVVLTLRDGAVAGVVFAAGEVLELLPAEGGWSFWQQATLPPSPGCAVVPTPNLALRSPALAATEAPAPLAAGAPKVDILILYSPEVGKFLGVGGGLASLQLLVDTTNTAFLDSGIEARLALVGTEEIPRPEIPDVGQMLSWMRSDAWVAAKREEYQADLVALIIEGGSGFCGFAQIPGRPETDAPFSVTKFSCAFRLIFPHEIGHNFGMHHEPEIAPHPEALWFPWSYGHYVNRSFRTIMAYGTECSPPGACGPIPQFSNPEIEYQGHRTGIADRRDNHRTANLTAPYIASRRGPAAPGPAPAAPTRLTAAAVSPTEVALVWVDEASDETGYQVEARAEGDLGWQPVAELPENSTTHSVTGLQPATTYHFRVRAVRGGSVSAYSNEATARTPPSAPSAPTGLDAEPSSATEVILRWDSVGQATGYEVEVRASAPDADREPAPIALGPDGAVVADLEAATPYTFRVRAVNDLGPSEWSAPASATTSGPGGPCVADDSTLCLLGERFEIRARWRVPRPPFRHGAGSANVAPGSERTGLFTFFAPDNVELVVKMLDGRTVNDAFWFYYGALSDVEYWLSVRDSASGSSRTYHNPPGERCGRGDTTAFVPGPEEPATDLLTALPPSGFAATASPSPGPHATASAGACTPGPETLCLADGRFRVQVAWENPNAGSEGSGRVVVGLESDATGHFWFFRPDNLELVVKILDGRWINDHFWIFWGSLSDVGYTIRVTDTETHRSHELENPPGMLCGGAVIDVL